MHDMAVDEFKNSIIQSLEVKKVKNFKNSNSPALAYLLKRQESQPVSILCHIEGRSGDGGWGWGEEGGIPSNEIIHE